VLSFVTCAQAVLDFVTADKFRKNGWPFFWPRVLEFGPCLALFSTRFASLAKSRSGNPGDRHRIEVLQKSWSTK